MNVTTAAKKPRIRRTQGEQETVEVDVRVVEVSSDDDVADVEVRVVDSAAADPDVVVMVAAPPLPDDHATAQQEDLCFAPPESDRDSEEPDEEFWFRPVPYLTSAVTHAALVLVLALVTLGPEVAKRSVTLGVIEKPEPFDDAELIEDDAFEMPRENTTSGTDVSEIHETFEVDDNVDIEPPSIDTADQNDSPRHLYSTGHDIWALAPDGPGPGGKNGGEGAKGTQSGTGSGQGAKGKDGAPSYAVRKGSFAAWTVPKDPRPLKPYKIIIQVTLPREIEEYTKDDLRGYVEGTDGYRQRIPQKEAKVPTRKELEEMIDAGNIRLGNGGVSGDRMARAGRAPAAERSKLKTLLRSGRLKMSKPAGGSFEYRSGRARLSVTVPGARNRVRDVIEIESKTLEERQVLEIEF